MNKFLHLCGAGALLAAASAAPAQARTTAPGAAVVNHVAPTPTQKLFGDFAPKFADLTDKVLNQDVWERPGLSKHDRSLVTVAALVAMNRPDQLRVHLLKARENGVTQEELVEAITQLGFYAGWPSAYSAMAMAKEVLAPKK